jgi:hypothetical protein
VGLPERSPTIPDRIRVLNTHHADAGCARARRHLGAARRVDMSVPMCYEKSTCEVFLRGCTPNVCTSIRSKHNFRPARVRILLLVGVFMQNKLTEGMVFLHRPSETYWVTWPQESAKEPIIDGHRKSLKEEKARILQIDRDTDSDFSRTALLVLAGAILVGPFVDRLIALTGLPHATVALVAKNMHRAQLWTNFSVEAEWFDGEDIQGTALFYHVAIAQGLVPAKWDHKRGCWTFSVVPAN